MAKIDGTVELTPEQWAEWNGKSRPAPAAKKIDGTVELTPEQRAEWNSGPAPVLESALPGRTKANPPGKPGWGMDFGDLKRGAAHAVKSIVGANMADGVSAAETAEGLSEIDGDNPLTSTVKLLRTVRDNALPSLTNLNPGTNMGTVVADAVTGGRVKAGMVEGGQVVKDAMQGVIDANPAAHNSIKDIHNPVDLLGFGLEKLAETAPQLGIAFATRSPAVMAGTTFAQQYGDTRETQEKMGIDDRGLAFGTAGTAGFLDAATGVGGKITGGLFNLLGREAVQEGAKQAGRGLVGRGISFGKTGLTEAGQETTQNVLQRGGSGQELTSPEAREEYATSALAGGLVGGTVGFVTGPGKYNPNARGQRPANFDPEQGVGEEVEVAPAAAQPPGVPTAPRGQQPGLFDLDDVLDSGIRPTETGKNPAQVSSQNARGAYQLLPSTAKQMAAELGVPYDEDKLLNDPAYNRALAKKYMSNLLQRYDGDMFSAVTAYHAGEGNTDRWIAKFGSPAEIGQQAFLDKVRAAGNPRSADYAAKVFGAMGRDLGEQAAPDPRTDTAFEDELAALAEAPAILSQLRGTRVDEAGKSLPADSSTIKLSNKLSTALKDGDVDTANAALDAETKSIDKKIEALAKEQEELEGARDRYTPEEFAERSAKFETQLDRLVLRSEVVQTGRGFVERFNEQLNTKQGDLFAQPAAEQVVAPPEPVAAPAENPFMGPPPVPVVAPQPAPEQPAAGTELAEGLVDEEVRAQEIASMAPAKATDASTKMRQHLLETVLSDPETKNPMARFRAELRKRGIDPTLQNDEGERIGKFEDAREAFTSGDQMVEPSAPDESGNFGIPERKAKAAEPTFQATPETGEFQQAPVAEAAPAPAVEAEPDIIARDNDAIRARADSRANQMGSSQRAWFLKGAGAALGDTDANVGPFSGQRPWPQQKKADLSRPHARWFKMGQDFVNEEVIARTREAAAKAKPAVVEAKAKVTSSEAIKAKVKAEREAKVAAAPKAPTPEAAPSETVAEEPAFKTSAEPSKRGPGTAPKSREAFRTAVDKAVGTALTAKQAQQLLAAADMEFDGTPTIPTLELWPMLDEALNAPPEPPKPTRGEQVTKKSKDMAATRVVKERRGPFAIRDQLRPHKKFEADMAAELERVGLGHLSRKIVTKLHAKLTGNGNNKGWYAFDREDPLYKMIVLVEGKGDNVKTLNHEIVHALRDIGLFKPSEWATLEKAAQADWFTKLWANLNYTGLRKSERLEEGVAEMYSIWKANKTTPPTMVGQIMQKIDAFFAAIGRAVGLSGMSRAEEIFKKIESGEIGNRTERYDRMTTVPPSRQSKAQRGGLPGLPKEIQAPVQGALDNVGDFAAKGGLKFNFTRDVAARAVKVGLVSAEKFIELHSASHALSREFDLRLADIKSRYERLPAHLRGRGPGTVNKFLYQSRTKEAWGYAPKGMNVTVDPAMAKKFNALPADAQAVVKAIFQYNRDARRELLNTSVQTVNALYDPLIAGSPDAATKAGYEAEKKQALKYFSRLQAAPDDTPYSPLKRTGNYVVVAMSRTYIAAKIAKDMAKMDELRSDPEHYFVDYRDTKGQANALQERLETKFGKGGVQNFERDTTTDADIGGSELYAAFAQLRAKVEKTMKDNPSDQTTKLLYRQLTDMYFQTLADTSARKGELKADMVSAEDPVTGEAIDMVRAFVERGQATSAFVAALHNSSKIHEAIEAMRAEAAVTTPGRDVRQRHLNELLSHYQSDLTRTPRPKVEAVKRGVSVFTLLTNPTYYAINLTQPMMFSLPMIAGRVGYGKAAAALTTAYGDILPMMRDAGVMDRMNFKNVPSDVKAVVEKMVNDGLLDSGMAQDLGSWKTNGEDPLSVVWNKADRILSQLPQNLENVNRLVTGIAAFRTLKDRGASDETAIAFAKKVVYDTHGDYSGFNAPTIMAPNSGLGQIAFQFRKFQFIMASLTAKMFYNSVKGESSEVRWAARKQLGWTLAHVTAFAGVVGAPAAATVGWMTMQVLKALGDDEEERQYKKWDLELEDKLKEMTGDSLFGDFVFKGAPYALLNMDLSAKLGMTNMVSVAPFADTDKMLDNRDSFAITMSAILLGAAGGLVGKAIDAKTFFERGDWYRGMESAMPSGFANMAKAHRLATRGSQATNGDQYIKPDDLNGIEIGMTALGIPVRKLTDVAADRSTQHEMGQHYSKMAAGIRARYNYAAKSKDAGAQAKAREDWMEMQGARKKDGLKVQPLSSLLKGPAAQAKRERNTMGGVQFNSANRKAVEELVD